MSGLFQYGNVSPLYSDAGCPTQCYGNNEYADLSDYYGAVPIPSSTAIRIFNTPLSVNMNKGEDYYKINAGKLDNQDVDLEQGLMAAANAAKAAEMKADNDAKMALADKAKKEADAKNAINVAKMAAAKAQEVAQAAAKAQATAKQVADAKMIADKMAEVAKAKMDSHTTASTVATLALNQAKIQADTAKKAVALASHYIRTNRMY